MRKRTKALIALGIVVILLGLLGSTFLAAPLPEPPALPGEEPVASPPLEVALFQLPTGITHRSAAFAYRGGSPFDKREFSMTAVLVRHPRGDFLIDTGFGRDIDAHFQKMPWAFRALTSYERSRSAAEQLDAAGYDRSRLQGIILTHTHWDHVSGIAEFPKTPVWVIPEERHFIENGGSLTAVIREFPNVTYHEYTFDRGAYLGFEKSHDVHGDGSIVIVPAPGHTPGSVIVFVTLPDKHRYAFVGDLCWQREGILEREERPWVQRTAADVNPALVRENLLRMAAITKRFPDLTLVPAHESRAFVGIAGMTRQ
ncbi:MAG TPA: MBL fold metallo-hydrolase [Polyangium sp.]|nr:MBL fold metallo-hydrolase [Polyangium sp.]